jgi:hypothetical protein
MQSIKINAKQIGELSYDEASNNDASEEFP